MFLRIYLRLETTECIVNLIFNPFATKSCNWRCNFLSLFPFLDTLYLWCNMHLENWRAKFKDSREMREMVCINVVLSVSSISVLQYFYFWRWSDAEGDSWLGSWGLTSISTTVRADENNFLSLKRICYLSNESLFNIR